MHERVLFVLLGSCCPSVPAVEPNSPDAIVQGEYTDGTLAAQLVANGDGKFDLVLLGGGFPGAGWDGSVHSASGTSDALTGDGYVLRVAGDALEGTDPLGQSLLLGRVERVSPTLGASAPPDGVVLFDGTNVDEWSIGRLDGDVLAAEGAGCQIGSGAITKRVFADFTLHLEFQIPFMPHERGQDRGNSGVFLQNRYELQVVDSFGRRLLDPGTAGDVCGELYRQTAVRTNASLPPLAWQTYDVDFTAARYDGDHKITNAIVTARLNGVLIHEQVEIAKDTSNNSGEGEGPEPRPLMLQDHNAPVKYRNIWVVPL